MYNLESSDQLDFFKWVFTNSSNSPSWTYQVA